MTESTREEKMKRASHYVIKEPYWKFKAVGLSEGQMFSDMLTVEILYKNNEGKREYPGVYQITKKEALGCMVHIVNKTGTRLRIVPIVMLERIK